MKKIITLLLLAIICTMHAGCGVKSNLYFPNTTQTAQ